MAKHTSDESKIKVAIAEALGLEPNEVMKIVMTIVPQEPIGIEVSGIVNNSQDKAVSEIIRTYTLTDMSELKEAVAGG